MRRASRWIIVLVGAAAVVAAWLQLRREDAPPVPEPTPHTAARAEVPRAKPGPRASRHAVSCAIDGLTLLGSTPTTARVLVRQIDDRPPPSTVLSSQVLGRSWLDVPVPAPPLADVASDAAGSFTVESLAPGSYLVSASFPDGRRAARSVELGPASARLRVVLLATTDGLPLRGRAVRRDGTQFDGWFGVGRIGADRALDTWLPADERGAFALDGLAPGQVRVVALDAGRRFAEATVMVPRRDEVVLELDPEGRTRRGRLVSAADGSPVAGASIVFGVHAATGVVRELATSRTDGAFEFTTWSGTTQLEIAAQGFGRTVQRVDCTSEDEVVVRLRPATVVLGRVLRAQDGTPVADAVVHVLSSDPRTFGREVVTRSDAGGGFRAEVALTGDDAVFVLGGGWASEGLAAARWGTSNAFAIASRPGESLTVDLAVVRTARAAGRVLDKSGTPLPGVTVRGRPDLEASNWVAMAWRAAPPTANDGIFELSDLLPDADWSFGAWPAAGVPSFQEPRHLAPGESACVDLRIEAPRTIEVSVLDAESASPIAGAVVTAALSPSAWGGQEGPAASATALTDANGAAALASSAPAASVVVRASADGYAPSQKGTVPESEGSRLRALVRLRRAKPLTGRIVPPAGVPFESLRVNARNSRDRDAPLVFGTVDANGQFAFDALSDDVWDLYAVCDWFGTQAVEKASARPGDPPVVITMLASESRPSLRLRVLDAEAVPLAEGTVAYWFSGSDLATSGTAAIRGGAAVLPLPPTHARALLEVRPGLASRERSGATLVELPVPAPREFDVRLPVGRRVGGRVVGPKDEPVPGARVFAQPAVEGGVGDGMRTDADAHATADVDRDGRFELFGLGETAYALSVHVPSGYRSPPATTVRAGTTVVEIRVAAGADATIAVDDQSGQPVAESVVRVSGRIGAVASARGVAQVVGLDPTGTYLLRVEPPASRDDLVAYEVEKWSPADTRVHLESADAIAGRVCGADGRPAPRATVLYAPPQRGWLVTTADDEGHFRLGVRRNETVRIRAIAEGFQDLRLPAGEPAGVAVQAGGGDVVVQVDDATAASLRVEGVPPGATIRWVVQSRAGALDVPSASGTLSRDVTLRFADVVPSVRHRLFVGPTPGGLYGLTDLRPGSANVVRLVAGERLTGRVVVPPGVRLRDVEMNVFGDAWTSRMAVDDAGAFSFLGLPPGDCSLSGTVVRDGKVAFAGTVAARTGDFVTIELTPRTDK